MAKWAEGLAAAAVVVVGGKEINPGRAVNKLCNRSRPTKSSADAWCDCILIMQRGDIM